MARYCITLLPSEAVINEVRELKLKLQETTGACTNAHSQAHITFNLFSGGEATLRRWQDYTAQFASQAMSFTCCLDRTGHFSNGAFFLAPDEESKLKLVRLMKAFHQSAPKGSFGKSVQPHVTIGRKLSTAQLLVAKEITGAFSLNFDYNNLTICIFDPQLEQYALLERWNFKKVKEVKSLF